MENQNDINNEENKNAIKLDLNDSIISSQDKKDKEKDKEKISSIIHLYLILFINKFLLSSK